MTAGAWPAWSALEIPPSIGRHLLHHPEGEGQRRVDIRAQQVQQPRRPPVPVDEGVQRQQGERQPATDDRARRIRFGGRGDQLRQGSGGNRRIRLLEPARQVTPTHGTHPYRAGIGLEVGRLAPLGQRVQHVGGLGTQSPVVVAEHDEAVAHADVIERGPGPVEAGEVLGREERPRSRDEAGLDQARQRGGEAGQPRAPDVDEPLDRRGLDRAGNTVEGQGGGRL